MTDVLLSRIRKLLANNVLARSPITGQVAAVSCGLIGPDPVLDLALIGRVVWDDVEHVRAMTRSVVRGPLREQFLRNELGPLHVRIVADAELAARTGAGLPSQQPCSKGAEAALIDSSQNS